VGPGRDPRHAPEHQRKSRPARRTASVQKTGQCEVHTAQRMHFVQWPRSPRGTSSGCPRNGSSAGVVRAAARHAPCHCVRVRVSSETVLALGPGSPRLRCLSVARRRCTSRISSVVWWCRSGPARAYGYVGVQRECLVKFDLSGSLRPWVARQLRSVGPRPGLS
jgi:hypothetical protein